VFSQPENAQKCVGGRGSAPDPTGGAYSAPPDPLAGLRGSTSKGRGGEGRRGGRQGEGKEGGEGGEEERGRERKGGKCPLSEILKTPLRVSVSDNCKQSITA